MERLHPERSQILLKKDFCRDETGADCQRLCAFPSGIPGQDRGRDAQKAEGAGVCSGGGRGNNLFLKEYHYLDDQEYARKYVRTAGAGKSIRQLRQSLLSKGISREILDLCFEEETVDEEEAVRRF